MTLELTSEELEQIKEAIKDYNDGMFSDESYALHFAYLMIKIFKRRLFN